MTDNLKRAREIAIVNAGGADLFRVLPSRVKLDMIADALDELRAGR